MVGRLSCLNNTKYTIELNCQVSLQYVLNQSHELWSEQIPGLGDLPGKSM